MKRWPWLALVAVLVVAAGVIALQSSPPPEEAVPASGPSQPRLLAQETQPMLVEGVRVEARSLVERATYHGTLQPLRMVTLTPKAAGRVAAIEADVGDRVEAGQVLLRLETTEAEVQARQAEAAVAAARAQLDRLLAGATEEELEQIQAAVRQAALQLEQAQAELARVESLYAKGGVSAQAYENARTQAALAEAALRSAEARLQAVEAGAREEDVRAAQAQLRQAEAGLELARTQLANALLEAPFSGVVSQRSAEVGALLSPGAPAFTLVDLEELKILLRVPGREVLALTPGAPARIRVEGLEGAFTGRVHRINPVADPQTNLFGVEVRLPNEDQRLRAGLTATVELPLRQVEEALAVPARAVVTRNQQRGVYVVEEDVVRFQPIEVGLRDGDWVEARSGLNEGAIVVTAGVEFLEPGQRVRLQLAQEPATTSASTGTGR